MIKFVLNVPLQSASFRYPFSSSIEMFIVRPCMRPQQACLLFSSGASLLLRPLLQQKIFLIFAKIFRLVYGDKDFIEGGGYMTAHSQIDAFTYLVAKVQFKSIKSRTNRSGRRWSPLLNFLPPFVQHYRALINDYPNRGRLNYLTSLGADM